MSMSEEFEYGEDEEEEKVENNDSEENEEPQKIDNFIEYSNKNI